ncbi:hypothetical protein [Methylobacterium sp.]|jgi:hypothetical protein|uniref:hypothetical protein n=1 Tax=Methylobacterium sp. TaxID=409 RepID=UPI00261381C8|nr:hypothetical protein [Methylobacterium sp.]MDB5645837.1 hypothetical protein [Methylobacterium sp.]
MSDQPSHVVDRLETKAAKGAERERIAHAAWAELHDASRVQDEKTVRLKALRLAQRASPQG